MTAVVHVDLGLALPSIERTAGGAAVVFWFHDVALGSLDLASEELPVSSLQLSSLAASAVAPAVAAHLTGSTFRASPPGAAEPRSPVPLPALAPLLEPDPLERALAMLDARVGVDAGHISVVVCTRDRPDDLARCLGALERLSTKPSEIIVVDNASTTSATREVVERAPGVRYVAEPRPGLSVARNTGVTAATGDVIAFTDDDGEVHPDWVARLGQAFASPEVDVVTGLVLPSELESEGAVLFEKGIGGFGQGFQPRRFDQTWLAEGGTVWHIGAGANMAVRRRTLDRVGGFDERLGAGAAGCSEDSELWHRVLAAGGVCRYDPTVVVSHHHRPSIDEVRRMSRDYLRGHVAALVVQARAGAGTGKGIDWTSLERLVRRLPWHYAKRGVRRALGRGDIPTLDVEVRGFIDGLRLAPSMLRRPDRGATRARVVPYLRSNPYPRPWTEGLFFAEKMRAIRRTAPRGPFRDVLEVGAGTSSITSLLYPGARVVSLELDPADAASAAYGEGGAEFVCGDATVLPFGDDRFDAVTFFDVLEHIPDDAAAVREAWRVLRPGGWLLASSPNDTWRFPAYRPFAPVSPKDVEVMAEWGHVRRGYSLAEFESLVGGPASAWATFLSPLVAPGHDLGFARLPVKVRRALGGVVAPLGWSGSLLHRAHGPGLETAAAWQVPAE